MWPTPLEAPHAGGAPPRVAKFKAGDDGPVRSPEASPSLDAAGAGGGGGAAEAADSSSKV
jgi:hypothetical protein